MFSRILDQALLFAMCIALLIMTQFKPSLASKLFARCCIEKNFISVIVDLICIIYAGIVLEFIAKIHIHFKILYYEKFEE